MFPELQQQRTLEHRNLRIHFHIPTQNFSHFEMIKPFDALNSYSGEDPG